MRVVGRQGLVAVAVCLAAWTAVAHAAESAEERQYQHAPSAVLAERIAREAMDQGRLARAMNWVERMLRSPGATPKQIAWAARVRQDLRWSLRDQGFGNLIVTVYPADATLAVDGKEVYPRVSLHSLWLTEGTHDLAAIAPDYAGAQQIVTVAREEKRTAAIVLTLNRPPTLVIKTRATGEVWIDKVYAGDGLKGRFTTTAGTHLIEVREKGHHSWLREVSLAPGELVQFEVELADIASDNVPRTPRASTVNRPLLPHEMARPGVLQDAGSQAKSGIPELADTRKDRTRPAEVDHQVAPPPPAATHEPEVAEQTAEPAAHEAAEPPERAEPTVAAEAEAPSGPMSGSTKGWLFATAGLALAGGGVATAVYARNAAANIDATVKPSDPTYTTQYDAAQRVAYIGYGVAAVGGVGLVVGSVYLFGKGGLSRSGKGWTLTTVGVLTGAAAGYLLMSAMNDVSAANALPAKDPDYDRRYTAATQSAYIAYGTAGAAALLTGGGLYLLLTQGSGSVTAEAPKKLAEPKWAWTPWLGKGAGANFALRW